MGSSIAGSAAGPAELVELGPHSLASDGCTGATRAGGERQERRRGKATTAGRRLSTAGDAGREHGQRRRRQALRGLRLRARAAGEKIAVGRAAAKSAES